jgi:hypothetical protein
VTGAPTTWFDLITINVADPRAMARTLVDLIVLEDEDDGRWLALGTPAGVRQIGLQRADPREIGRAGSSRVTVNLRQPFVAEFAVLDPVRSSTFWCAAAGLEPIDGVDPDRRELCVADGTPAMRFVRTDPSSLVTMVPASVHLDLACEPDHFDAEIDRLLDLGAIRIGPRTEAPYGLGQMLIDPDGIVFCENAYLVEPGRRLASRGITATDGARPAP